MRIVDALIVWLPIILIAIALLLACALRIVRRGAASSPSLSAVADDPFLSPFGEMPTVPRERLMVARDFRAWGIPLRSQSAGERVSLVYGRGVRGRDASRPWEIPENQHSAAVAHRRNENGGRSASLSGTAVVLTFPKRRA